MPALILIWLPANAPGQAGAPATCVGDPDGAPGSWLQLGSAPATVDIAEYSLSLSSRLSKKECFQRYLKNNDVDVCSFLPDCSIYNTGFPTELHAHLGTGVERERMGYPGPSTTHRSTLYTTQEPPASIATEGAPLGSCGNQDPGWLDATRQACIYA